MTEREAQFGFWHLDRERNFPPRPITNFADYTNAEWLSLAITQLDGSASVQKKVIDTWCAALPTLTNVKYLWLTTRTNQKIFDAVCRMPNLEGLWVKWGAGVTDISPLIQLKKLKHLHLGGFTKVDSIELLGNFTQLKTLELEQFNKITDFTVVGKLTQLQGLGLDGSIWTHQKIDTLKPLQHLKKLRYLTLTATQIQDKSFDPILELPVLTMFSCSWNYPVTEFEKLKRMPQLKYGNVQTSWEEVKQKILLVKGDF